MLNGLDLFSGIGGISKALEPWVRPIAYCENDRYAQAVLLSRMGSGELPIGPIWDDVQSLCASSLLVPIDIIYAGFPCQPYSTCSRGRNPDCSLRNQLERVVTEIKPRFVFAENVSLRAFAGFLPGWKKTILRTSASEVGAPHIRRRYWLLAHSDNEGKPIVQLNDEVAVVSEATENIWKTTSAKTLRVVDGLPYRMDRIKALGNAVVPLQAREAFKTLMGLENGNWNSQQEREE